MKYWVSAHLWEFCGEHEAWNKPWEKDDAQGTARKEREGTLDNKNKKKMYEQLEMQLR